MSKYNEFFSVKDSGDNTWILDHMKKQTNVPQESSLKITSKPINNEETFVNNEEIPINQLLVLKSCEYKMQGVYLMVEINDYYHFIFQKDHFINKRY